MAKNKDPFTEQRREKFRDYCKSKGWKKESGGWASTEVAKHFNRKANQMNNILTGMGSFSPTVANALCQEAGLTAFYFEPDSTRDGISPVAYQLARTFDSFGFETEDMETDAYNAATVALVAFLKRKSST